MLTVLDEYTREALCVVVRPNMNAHNVLDALHTLLMKHGKPEFIRYAPPGLAEESWDQTDANRPRQPLGKWI